jgi:hypothetical protein
MSLEIGALSNLLDVFLTAEENGDQATINKAILLSQLNSSLLRPKHKVSVSSKPSDTPEEGKSSKLNP